MAIEYKTRLIDFYGDHLAEVVLFGSCARGDYREESDADFAIVFKDSYAARSMEMVRISSIGSGVSLKYGIPISPLRTTLGKKRTSQQGIYREIRKEGIAI